MTNDVSTVPAPRSSSLDGGAIIHLAGRPLCVSTDSQLAPAVRWLGDALYHAFGIDWHPGDVGEDISFSVQNNLPPSGYRLVISASPDSDVVGTPSGRVEVWAADLAGAFAAAQTLRQLGGPSSFRHAPLPGTVLTWPTGVIEDAPSSAWRGVHLDVARHFAPPREVRRFIELAAMHHLNVVQLHLTDDQGWRFESSRYPELTRTGAWRKASARGYHDANIDPLPHGGFYTQDDLREIVAFAHGVGVLVVPEIDLPGHVEAALAAYPWLGTRKVPSDVRTIWGISNDVLDPGPDQVAFFRDVLDEVCDVFDSPFIHVGGDEVPTTLWQRNPMIVTRAAALGFLDRDGQPDVSRLHGWFIGQLVEHLRSRGRRTVVWDEALGTDLPKDAIVMSWRGLRPGARAIEAGHDVVLAPEQFVYFDHRASDREDEPSPVGYVRRVEDVYAFDPSLLAEVPGGCEFTVA
ncbi:MAG: beta-N-acetylhexosaminidase, partial [Micrococcales bacterium]|nr:beta-N-acetylhexosaminidase [Micrococcales bacterium]